MKHGRLAFISVCLLAGGLFCSKSKDDSLPPGVGVEKNQDYTVPEQPRPVILPRPPESDARPDTATAIDAAGTDGAKDGTPSDTKPSDATTDGANSDTAVTTPDAGLPDVALPDTGLPDTLIGD